MALLLPIVCDGLHQQSKNAYQALAAGDSETMADREAITTETEADHMIMMSTEEGAEGAETETESETEAETETESETETPAEMESAAGSKAEKESEHSSTKEDESNGSSTPEAESETVSNTETESEAESKTESEGGSKTESETATGTETESKAEKESEAQHTTEQDSTAESETETEPSTLPEHPAQTEDMDSDRLLGTDSMDGPQDEQGDAQDIPKQPQNGVGLPEGTEDFGEGSLGEDTSKNDEAETGNSSEENGATESESGSESVSGTEENNEAETGNGSEGNSGVETGNELEGNSGTETGNEHEANSGSESGSETEENDATESESGTQTDSGTVTDGEPETDSAPKPESQTEKKKPKKIERGKHYEIVGDEGAYYRDQAGHLWIRAGSSLYVEAKGKSGFDETQGLNGLSQDGVFSFCLKKTDENGALLEQSELKQEQYFVDEEAPAADIVVSGESVEGIVYAADTAQAAVTVAPDGKSGLCSAAYRVIRCAGDGSLCEEPEKGEWISCGSDQVVEIKDEGLFQVFVRTKDHVGNTNFSKSSIICVDHTPPQIMIEGVQDQTANSGAVKIRIEGRDAYYKLGSLHVELIGKNGGKAPAVNRKKEMRDKAVIEFFDFPAQKGYDDVYRLCVRAEDMSGNRTEKEIGFSVNRYGSVYELSEDTGKKLKSYFLSKAIPIVFYETNIDYVGESQIYCRRDGELQSLVKDKDYFVTMQGSRDSWKQYCYTIPAEYFEKEGIYELLLASGDQANNKSDTGIQKKQVAFVLDRTAPECVITGIEENQVYREKTVTACLTPEDNTGIKSMKVYRNSELILTREEFLGRTETIRVSLEESDEWQTLQVFLQDGAGNTYWSREIPVFVGENVQKVPKYEKVRASAQELEQAERVSRKTKNKNRIPAVRRIQKTKMQASQGDVGGLTAGRLSAALSSSANRTPEGTALLIFGIAVFGVTAVSYVLSSGKNTGGRK